MGKTGNGLPFKQSNGAGMVEIGAEND